VKTINALTLRKKLGSILDEVHNKKTPIVISRANKPLVVMIPFEDYKEIKDEKERERRLRSAASKIDQWREKNFKQLKGLNSVELIRQMREER
jgi:prevent-host-death family protein